MEIARALSAAVLVLTAWVQTSAASPDASPPLSVDALYLEANEGSASGGHTALRVGDRVYHFVVHGSAPSREPVAPVAGRLLLLTREPWPVFLTRYNALENRGVHLASLDVPPGAALRIRDRLDRLLLVQTRHLEILDAMAFARRAMEAFETRSGAEVRLRGAGLFADSGAPVRDSDAIALRNRVREARGPGWLAEERRRAGREAASLSLVVGSTETDRLAGDRYPILGGSTGERLRDALQLREALAIIQEARPLRESALVDPLGHGESGLTLAELRGLERASVAWEASVLRLLDSRRPDRGGALLLAVARARALRRSLRDGRLWSLDPFPDRSLRVWADASAGRRQALESLERDASRAHRRWRDLVRARLRSGEALDEPMLNRLENEAGRHGELRAGLGGVGVIRAAAGRLTPSRSAAVRLPARSAPEPAGHLALAAARTQERDMRARLGEIYGYHLIERNCATELLHELAASFEDADAAELALGGRLDPGSALSFVPFAFFDRIGERFRVSGTRSIPSYRQRRVRAMREVENDLWVALREGNTLSSTVYAGAPVDGHFLLFTDESAWPRPIQGIANLAWGVGQAGAGLLTWPFDGGDRLARGLRGSFFSLPELAFFNVRKGSFEYNEEIGAAVAGGALGSQASPSRLRAVGETGTSSGDGEVRRTESASSLVTPYQ